MSNLDLTTALSKFSEAATRLNAASDSVNQIISNVEAQLVSANAGIEVFLGEALAATDTKETAGREDSWTAQFLGFAKIDGEWCLAVKSVRYVTGFFEGDTMAPYRNEYVDAEPDRLSRSPRSIRIAALEQLPALVDALAERAVQYTEVIEKAKALA